MEVQVLLATPFLRNMNCAVVNYEEKYFNDVANLIARFRVTLQGFKGLTINPDFESAKEELKEYLNEKYPLYVALVDNKVVGYILLRVHYVVWIEHIFVLEEYRRQGIASLLFDKAEQYSDNLQNDTVFNYVHPNNNVMISFLKSKGYSVLNLIEIRKPFNGEKTTTKVKVGDNEFDY